jgi:Na+/H+-dicarboxylate symporter
MRVVADFLIVIGAMLLMAAMCIIAIEMGHVPVQEYPLLVTVVMAAMLGTAMVTVGILVHLRKWQKQ